MAVRFLGSGNESQLFFANEPLTTFLVSLKMTGDDITLKAIKFVAPSDIPAAQGVFSYWGVSYVQWLL